MIKYHAQYISSYKLIMITSYVFSDRLIFLARVLYSEHNFLTYHNFYFGIKQDTKTQIRIQILFITASYSNSTFSLALRTLIFSHYWFLYNCRVVSYLRSTPLAVEFWYGKLIYIFNALHSLNYPKTIVSVSIYIYIYIYIHIYIYIIIIILSCRNEYIYSYFL